MGKVRCEICGGEFNKICGSHLSKHNITLSEYIKLYPYQERYVSSCKSLFKERPKKEEIDKYIESRASYRRACQLHKAYTY